MGYSGAMKTMTITATEKQNWQAFAVKALEIEHTGLAALVEAAKAQLGENIAKAVGMIMACSGRVIISGIGKSGHVGRKMAATLASTGTPASYVHPAEASHGDLGMIMQQDVVIVISNSGESPELRDILDYTRRFDVPLIAVCGKGKSALAKAADLVLLIPKVEEACPIGLAPTTSTLLQMALGDALAVTLLEAKGFAAQDFHAFHPGGKLGAKLKQVKDVMHRQDSLPLVALGSLMADALVEMSARSFGCLGIIDQEQKLVGMITDGDLRRHMGPQLLSANVDDVMTANPKTLQGSVLASEALERMNRGKITTIFVVNENHHAIGLIHIHDLLRLGVS